ncbi:MAG: hypothetical protein IPM56_01570 [Ignavibacteriales bacterium]|nr:MAG: hypothetical protein IPM56_01570 [Ignavibacteriales bacterium]
MRQKVVLSAIIFVLYALILFSGCTSTEQVIYLQDIKVTGPVNVPPVHLMQDGEDASVTISPRVIYHNNSKNISGKVEGHTKVNEFGVLQLDTIMQDGRPTLHFSDANRFDYDKDNFSWSMPEISAGLDIDFKISKLFAVGMGIGFTNSNSTSLINGNVSVGTYSVKENFSLRFDLGILFQEYQYFASTVVVTTVRPAFTSEYTIVSLFRDRGKEMHLNPFVQLTYNSSVETLPVNFFLSFGIFGQTLTDFEPNEYDPEFSGLFLNNVVDDTRGESSAAFINASPGFFFNVTPNHRIAFGARCMYAMGIEELSKKFFVFPFAQFDFSF